jgi:hypothetical protein
MGMEGLICAGGLASVAAGYYAYLVADDLHPGEQRFKTIECPDGFCPLDRALQLAVDTGTSTSAATGGTKPTNRTSLSLISCVPPRLNSPDNLLCGNCQPGWIPWGSACVRCTGPSGPLVFAFLVGTSVLVFFLLISSGGSSSGLVSVFVYWIQTSALEVGPVSQWITWVGVVNLDHAGMNGANSCIAPLSPYEQTLFTIMTPMILLGELGVIAAINFAIARYLQSRAAGSEVSGRDIRASTVGTSKSNSIVLFLYRAKSLLLTAVTTFNSDRYIGGAFAILLFCYTSVCVSCLRFFYCVEIGDARVVFTAPTMDCESATYRRYFAFVVFVVIFFVIGLPLGALAWLWKHKDILAQSKNVAAAPNAADVAVQGGNKEESEAENQDAAHRAALLGFFWRYGPLFGMYSAKAWYWQSLVLVRRACFVLSSVFLVRDPAGRFLTFALLNFASLMMHLFAKQFSDEKSNRAEAFSHVLLVVLSMVLLAFPPPYREAVQIIITLLIVPACAVFAISLAINFWKQTVERRRRKRRAASSGHNGRKVSESHKVELAEIDLGNLSSSVESRKMNGAHHPPSLTDSKQSGGEQNRNRVRTRRED